MDRSEPCAKCRTLIYASAFHTCPKESCYYHLPYRPAPPPPAEQASSEDLPIRIATLEQLVRDLTKNPNFDFAAIDYTAPQQPTGECQHEWAEGYGVPAYCKNCGEKQPTGEEES